MSKTCEYIIFTVFQNPYMKEDFFIKIETIHLPDAGTTENVGSCLKLYCYNL